MKSLTQTINLAGAVSGLFIGFFSDRFGRKRCALALAIVLASLLSLWQLFLFKIIRVDNSTSYIIYCVIQFCCGAMAKAYIYINIIKNLLSNTQDQQFILFSLSTQSAIYSSSS